MAWKQKGGALKECHLNSLQHLTGASTGRTEIVLTKYYCCWRVLLISPVLIIANTVSANNPKQGMDRKPHTTQTTRHSTCGSIGMDNIEDKKLGTCLTTLRNIVECTQGVPDGIIPTQVCTVLDCT